MKYLKFGLVLVAWLAVCNPSRSQTNSGGIAPGRGRALEELNRCFEIKRSAVDEYSVLTWRNWLLTPHQTKLSAYCIVDKATPAPKVVTLHYVRKGGNWKLAEYARVAINYDGQKKEFLDPKVETHVVSGGDGVVEQLLLEVRYSEFSAMARARQVHMRVGTEEFEIPVARRADWLALVNYYDPIYGAPKAKTSKTAATPPPARKP